MGCWLLEPWWKPELGSWSIENSMFMLEKKICFPKHGSGCIRNTQKKCSLSTKSPSVQTIAGNWCQISIHPSPWFILFWHLFWASAPDRLLPLKPRGPRMLFNNTATLPKTPIDLVPNCKTSLISSLCLRTSQDSSHQRGAGIGWTELQYVELMLDISYMDNYGYIMIYLISYIWIYGILWILWILSIDINVWIYLMDLHGLKSTHV